jgi:hypothetical protein
MIKLASTSSNNTQIYKFEIDNDIELEFIMQDEVFTPTGTSDLIIKAVRDNLLLPGKLLDMGCGAGINGITLNKLGLVKGPIFASDISSKAVHCAKENAKLHKCAINAREGSLFEPWYGETFDYIINDVSGVANAVAQISPWFDGVPCFSGNDGTELICKILDQSPEYLNKHGALFFPVLSLSKIENILNKAKKVFSVVKPLIKQTWPMPKSMMKHSDFLLKLADDGLIQIEHSYGTLLWTTEIYVAKV